QAFLRFIMYPPGFLNRHRESLVSFNQIALENIFKPDTAMSHFTVKQMQRLNGVINTADNRRLIFNGNKTKCMNRLQRISNRLKPYIAAIFLPVTAINTALKKLVGMRKMRDDIDMHAGMLRMKSAHRFSQTVIKTHGPESHLFCADTDNID